MAKKALEALSEPMFYVLMAFQPGPRCGTEIASSVEKRTQGRVRLGPGTLYTILAKFEEEGLIREQSILGRKRTYSLTELGEQRYQEELRRLRVCLRDAAETERELSAAPVPTGEEGAQWA